MKLKFTSVTSSTEEIIRTVVRGCIRTVKGTMPPLHLPLVIQKPSAVMSGMSCAIGDLHCRSRHS